jgi:hypothetical protein
VFLAISLGVAKLDGAMAYVLKNSTPKIQGSFDTHLNKRTANGFEGLFVLVLPMAFFQPQLAFGLVDADAFLIVKP